MPIDSIKNLPLKGVRIADITRFIDERGLFHEIMRADWKALLESDTIVQANLSITYPNIVRAWHRHLRGQIDYFLVVKGAVKVGVYDDKSKHLLEVVLTDMKPQILRVPGHYWHGFKALGIEPAILLYFTTRLYDYTSPDEERRPWNDPTIIPMIINGRTDDPRCGKPWNWFYPPHK